MPGLVNLCQSLWFLFPKERYTYKNTRSEARTSTTDNNCARESTCSTNRCANGTSASFSDCGNRNDDDHNFINYDDFNGMVDASDHDPNDSMEDDLFTVTIHHSVSDGKNNADVDADADTDETL